MVRLDAEGDDISRARGGGGAPAGGDEILGFGHHVIGGEDEHQRRGFPAGD